MTRAPVLACPVPLREYEAILLGHGSGGRLGQELIADIFVPAFGNDSREDAAVLPFLGGRLAMTTDAFVVDPIFFPGGDIGCLAVYGTVNDLSVGGAVPTFLSAAFVLEEGLAISDLERVVASMRRACDRCGVRLVTGDTKVVQRGKADRLFITTTGIGTVPAGINLSATAARAGDRVLVSGTLGDHGIAILSSRAGIAFETDLVSDCAPVHELVAAVLAAAPAVRCMRDPTRGGLSASLHEIAAASGVGVRLLESALPVRDEVHGACELLGLDPLHVANEGKLVAIVPPAQAGAALQALQGHPLGERAADIGEVVAAPVGLIAMLSRIGGERVVPLLAGEQLPRIC